VFTMTSDVVIFAKNEATTVTLVVAAWVNAREQRPDLVGQIIVIDDGSDDNTGDLAADAGATVVPGPGLGKGEGLSSALDHITAEQTILCDGGIHGFTVKHALLLASSAPETLTVGLRYARADSLFDRACGMDVGWFSEGGERACPTWLLRGVGEFRGFCLEVQIREAAELMGLPIHEVILHGVGNAGPVLSHAELRAHFRERAEANRPWLTEWWRRIATGEIDLRGDLEAARLAASVSKPPALR
jgi:glycosyltransferase involved in cell wall biosynthesis